MAWAARSDPVAGGTGAPTTIQNHGTIGNAAVAVGIYESGPASIYNVGGAGSLAVIEGRTVDHPVERGPDR